MSSTEERARQVWLMYMREFLSSIKKNKIICMKMNTAGDHSIKQIKPDTEREILSVFFCLWFLDLM